MKRKTGWDYANEDENGQLGQFYTLNTPLSNSQHDQIYLILFDSFLSFKLLFSYKKSMLNI